MDRTVEMVRREQSFRGTAYALACTELEPQDPSWFTYVDEAAVRDRDWTVFPGDVVWDVGAAFGSYTVTALASGAASVIAWSPQTYPLSGIPEAEYLRQTLALNGWSDRVRIEECGVFSREGWLDCLTQEFFDGLPDEIRELNDLLRVRTLDSYVDRRRTRCDLLKLDVEGAEAEVLAGASLLLEVGRPRAISVELHRFKVPDMADKVLAVLGPAGYRLLRDVPHHGVSHALYVPA